ncbi:MAG: Adenosine deaminase [Planctomycetota bacterium]|nr:Adenosine deaminase [Planctomycetota bacterium]
MRGRVRSLGARWVFPVEGPPLPDALVLIADGRIAEIRGGARRSADIDLGNSAVLPGFVNAHTHLELSPIPGEPWSEENEIAWLARVIAQRRGSSVEGLRAAVARNLASAISAGTTLVADTTTAGLSWNLVAEAPIRALVFCEMIGLRRQRGIETVHEAFAWLSTIRPEMQVVACARPGLSPHAPYSTAGWIYDRAATAGVPLSTHLAEMPEELQLLRCHNGPMRQFLEDLGAWDDAWEPLSPRPADYVRKGDLRRSDWIIAHGTYLEPDDFWQLRPASAPNGQRVAVAFCPRTHARFGHARHPYREILASGGIVCLGTDSLASAPSLGILDEVRALHRSDPSLSGPLLLTMATLFGAWALRAESVTGSLKPGKSADLAIVGLPDRHADDPHALILDSDFPVIATMFEGQFVAGLGAGR